MQTLFDSIDFILGKKAENPAADKAFLQAAFIHAFNPTKARSVLVADGFALRFSEARTGSFSNTVLSLSALQAYDAAIGSADSAFYSALDAANQGYAIMAFKTLIFYKYN